MTLDKPFGVVRLLIETNKQLLKISFFSSASVVVETDKSETEDRPGQSASETEIRPFNDPRPR